MLIMDGIENHLEKYGIVHFSGECYYHWLPRQFSEEKFGKIHNGFDNIGHENITKNECKKFYNLIGTEETSGKVHSQKAHQMKCSGEFADKWIVQGYNVLDIGCHTGHLTTYFGRRKNYIDILGVDVSGDSIKYARKMAKKIGANRVQFEETDFLELDKENEYDLVISTQSLYYNKDMNKVANKIKRLTNKDGLIVAVEPLNTAKKINDFIGVFKENQFNLVFIDFLMFRDVGCVQGNPAMVFQKNGIQNLVNIDEGFSKFEKNILFERMLLENLKMKKEILSVGF